MGHVLMCNPRNCVCESKGVKRNSQVPRKLMTHYLTKSETRNQQTNKYHYISHLHQTGEVNLRQSDEYKNIPDVEGDPMG